MSLFCGLSVLPEMDLLAGNTFALALTNDSQETEYS